MNSKKVVIISSEIFPRNTQVRVDFNDIDSKAVFGEMTFTTGYGYYTDDYYKYLGSKINLH